MGRIPTPELFYTKSNITSYLRKKTKKGVNLEEAIDDTKNSLKKELETFKPDIMGKITKEEFEKNVFEFIDNLYKNTKINNNYIKSLNKKYTRKGCAYSAAIIGIPTLLIIVALSSNNLEDNIKNWYNNKSRTEEVVNPPARKYIYFDTDRNTLYDSVVSYFNGKIIWKEKMKHEVSKEFLKKREDNWATYEFK